MTGVRRRAQSELLRARQDLSFATSAIGVTFAAATAINLIQHGFNIHLNWGFAHFLAFYRDALFPLINVIQWPVRAILEALDLKITVPAWLKDLHILSFVLGGLYVRGWSIEARARAQQELETAEEPGGVAGRGRLEITRRAARMTFSDMLLQTVKAFVIGLFGASYPLWLHSLGAVLVTRSDRYWREWDEGTNFFDPATRRGREQMARHKLLRYRFRNLVRLTAMVALAVAIFYIANALVPQLSSQIAPR
jgi:hypothetical protein